MTRQPSSAEAVSQPVVAANGTTVVNENTGEKFKGTAVLGDEQLAVPSVTLSTEGSAIEFAVSGKQMRQHLDKILRPFSF